MRVSTVMMFAIAFLCAGVAAFLVRGMLASRPEAVAVTRGTPLAMRTVVVAAHDLKPGQTLTAELMREANLLPENTPKGAFTTKDALLNGGQPRVVAVPILENEPILQTKIYDRDSALVSRLSAGMSAVTIRVNDASGVGGFAQPEDRVDVLLTQTDRPGEGAPASRAFTVTLLKNVRVLAADQQFERKPQAQPPKIVTLEVTAEDAKKVTLASEIGHLSLTLNKGTSEGDDGRVIDLNDLIQRDPVQVKPVIPVTVDPLVTITRGSDKSVEKKEYKVPAELGDKYRRLVE